MKSLFILLAILFYFSVEGSYDDYTFVDSNFKSNPADDDGPKRPPTKPPGDRR